MNVLDLSLVEMHQALVDKKTTPLELTTLAIARAKADTCQAFELITETQALAQASALTSPEVNNLFWGIPYVMKDNFSTKGLETTSGSDILKGYQPLFDATVYERLQQANAILIGKATMDELAMGGTGMTGHKGWQYNPYDPSHQRQIGGSSSGSAAVVASGIVPFALGSDTGDSVRKPAAYAGLVGFKPTWGRISRYGLFPFAPSLDHVGYFTRTVEDAAHLTTLLSGHDPHDATSTMQPLPSWDVFQSLNIRGKKIALIQEVMEAIRQPDIKQTFLASVEALKQAGAEIHYVSFPLPLLQAIYPTYMTISCAEATSNNANLDGLKFGPGYTGDTYQDVMMQARTKGFSELIKRRFVIGSYVLMRDNQHDLFLRAQKVRRLIVNTLHDLYKTYDVIYLPAAPTIAPKFTDSSDRLSSEYLIADSHLALGNFAGLPSVTIPLGFVDGMPIAGNVMGRAYEEWMTLKIASAIEQWTGLKNLSIHHPKARKAT
jgi:aspartyl-tRNA(Asn)/glutamyl-tRNA(Gln) amidotransferase subunit A